MPARTRRARLTPEQRQRQVLTAARDVFIDSGFAGATVKEIAKKAGVTATSVYAHFSSKDEIYRQAVEEPLHALVAEVRDQMHELAGQPGTDRKAVLGRANEIFLAAMSEIAPLLAVAMIAQPAQSRDFYTTTVWPQMHEAIDAVIEAGFPGAHADPDVATFGFLGVHYTVVMTMLLLERPLDIPSTAAQITALFQRTIRPDVPVAAPATSTQPKRRQRERLPAPDRRRMILEAAREIFLEKGLAATRMKDVAERAGLKEAGLYTHFASKEEVYQAAVHEPLERLINRYTTATSHLAAQTGMDRRALQVQANEQLLRYLVELTPLLAVALFAELEPGRRYYQDVLLPKLEGATLTILKVIYGPQTRENELGKIAEAMVGVNLGLALDSFMRGRLVDFHDLAVHLIDGTVGAPVPDDDLDPADPARNGITQARVQAAALAVNAAGNPPRRSRLPAAERRQMIIEAARQAFCESGSAGASIREVAQRGGVSEPTIYQHFDSRDELYRAAIEDHLAGLFEVAAGRARTIASDGGLDRDAILVALNELYLQLMIDTAPLSAVSFFEVAGRGKTLYQSTIHRLMVNTATPFYEVLTGRQLAPDAEDVVMMSVFGMHYGVALDAIMRGSEVDIEQMAARITDVYR